jgi:TPR repeat protein
MEWFTKAAEENHHDAQYNMSLLYGNGYGDEQDLNQSLAWYTKSANNGSVDGRFNVGIINFYGKGVQNNHVEALHWL